MNISSTVDNYCFEWRGGRSFCFLLLNSIFTGTTETWREKKTICKPQIYSKCNRRCGGSSVCAPDF